MKVLLVDDDKEQLDAIRNYLIFNGKATQVVLAKDDREALAKAKSGKWGVFLLDRQLRAASGTGATSGDGLVLAVVLRKNASHKEVPIVVYSAGWAHADYDKETYEPRGIFACDGAEG